MEEQLPAHVPDVRPQGRDEQSSQQSSQSGSARPRGHQGGDIPSIDRTLEMLMQLNGLIMLGMISTAKANAVHRNLRAILDTQMKRQSRNEDAVPQEGLLELCRENPKALNILQDFLTPQQVEWILQKVTDDAREEA